MERRRVADAGMDAYLGWRDQCDAVQQAYGRWAAACESEAALAFRVYTAALDREQHTSEVYAGLLQRAREVSGHGYGAENPPAVPARQRQQSAQAAR